MTPDQVQALGGVIAAPLIAAIVEGIYGAFPGIAKGSRVLISLAVGIGWSFLVAYSVDSDYRLAPLTGVLVGLAAANPRAVLQWNPRGNGDRPDGSHKPPEPK